MKWFTKFAANNISNNLSYKFRSKRFHIFENLLERKFHLRNPLIVDIGGANYYWEQMKLKSKRGFNVALVNLSAEAIQNFKGIVGDAKNISFIKDKTIEVIHSNSLIEHLGTYENQFAFAQRIKKLSKYYFIQTPAFIFPIEPHFLMPFFHWLPKQIRILLVQNFNLGWYKKETDKTKAEKYVSEIRIMKKRELKKLFPHEKVLIERFFFIPKSYIITNL